MFDYLSVLSKCELDQGLHGLEESELFMVYLALGWF